MHFWLVAGAVALGQLAAAVTWLVLVLRQVRVRVCVWLLAPPHPGHADHALVSHAKQWDDGEQLADAAGFPLPHFASSAVTPAVVSWHHTLRVFVPLLARPHVGEQLP